MPTIDSRSAPLPPLLRLPEHLRREIYYEAGFIRSIQEIDCFLMPIDFNREPDADPPSTWLQATHSLLLTCRMIYAEAALLLYSENRFLTNYTDADGFKALRNLTPASIAHLTELIIHLSPTPSDRLKQWDYTWMCHEGDSRKHTVCHENGRPLEAWPQAILSDWQATVNHINAHIKPSRLKLYFVSDVDGLEAAKQVLEPLGDVSTLADCSIRLGKRSDPILRDLAQRVAMQATGRHQIKYAFPFMSLPRELRLQILEYTDLVTPLCEIEWSPEKRFYLHYNTIDCPGWLNGAMHFPGCYLHPRGSFYPRNCWQYAVWPEGCFCRRYHAAFSSTCRCWIPPTPFFAVCKKFQEDAQAIFFGKNRFIVSPTKGCGCPVDRTPARLETSAFLRAISPQALHFLRFLEVVFPPFHNDYLLHDEPAYEDWLQTIEYAKEVLNLPTLTLVVSMADYSALNDLRDTFRTKLTKAEGFKIIETYRRCLAPLSKLRENGLNRFVTNLAWPWSHCPWYKGKSRSLYAEMAQYLKSEAEQLVMGQDYNGILLPPVLLKEAA